MAINRRFLVFYVTLALLGALCQPQRAIGQESALRQLVHGKRLFWEAEFNQSRAALEAVLQIPGLKSEHRYEAHLFLAFTLVRGHHDATSYRPHLDEAVRIDFHRTLDAEKYPPDLIDDYVRVRDSMVGYLRITSEPEAQFKIIDGDSIQAQYQTPVKICELVENTYQLLFSKDGYDQQLLPLSLTAGKTDTLFVRLKKY